MTAAQWITVASLAAVVVSALAIVAGLKSVRDQLRMAIFLEYTKRYSKIMQHMPFEARQPRGRYKLASQPENEHRILSAFREYLNMCSEEKMALRPPASRPGDMEHLGTRDARYR